MRRLRKACGSLLLAAALVLGFTSAAFAQASALSSVYPGLANQVTGSASTTGTSAVELIAAPSAIGSKLYVASAQCGRTDAGTTALTVTFNDTKSTTIVVPGSAGGGGNNPTYAVPLVVAANTRLTFTSDTGVTTLKCSAQGYSGS